MTEKRHRSVRNLEAKDKISNKFNFLGNLAVAQDKNEEANKHAAQKQSRKQ